MSAITMNSNARKKKRSIYGETSLGGDSQSKKKGKLDANDKTIPEGAEANISEIVSTRKKAAPVDMDTAFVYNNERPRVVATNTPGQAAPGFSGKAVPPFTLCLLSTDGGRFSILKTFDAGRSGEIIYQKEKGSRAISDLPGENVTNEIGFDGPMFGDEHEMFLLTSELRAKVERYLAKNN